MTIRQSFEQHWVSVHKNGPKGAIGKLRRDEEQPDVYAFDSTNRHWVTWQAAISRQEAKIKALVEALEELDRDWRQFNVCAFGLQGGETDASYSLPSTIVALAAAKEKP